MRKLSAILILMAGTAWGAGGTQYQLNVNTGTVAAVDTYTNADGAVRQAIVLGDFSSSDTLRINNVVGIPVYLSSQTTIVAVPVISTNTLTVQPVGVTTVTFNGTGQPVTGTFWQATQPISGTVIASQATAASLKASVLIDGTSNTVQLTGAIPAGTNSIGTVSINNPASGVYTVANSTNPLLIQSTSAIPSSQSGTWGVNINNPGSGVYTVQNSTNPLLIQSTSTLPANVSQINGVTPLMGNGATGTGSPRVTIASDSLPHVVNLSTSVANAANTTVVYVSTFANVAASQTAQILVAGIASTKLRVVNVALMAGGTATNVTFNTNTTAMSPLFAAPANGGIALQRNDMGWFETVAGEPLTITTGAGSTTGIIIGYLKI